MRRIALVAALASLPLAVAACGTATGTGAGSGGSGSGGGTGGSGQHTTGASPTGPTAQPRQYAARLLAGVRVPARAVPVRSSPSKALSHAPEMPIVKGQPVVLHKYWTVDEPESQVLTWLHANLPAGVMAQGNGTTGGSGLSEVTYFSYGPRIEPIALAIADLYVAVVPTGSGGSAIGAFAEAMTQPTRPAAEHVPTTGVSAVVAWSIAEHGTPALKNLTGSDAAKLAREFDAMKVSVLSWHSCPFEVATSQITVTFDADGHSWRVIATNCAPYSVTRDGQALPGLTPSKAFMTDLTHWAGHRPGHFPGKPGGVTPLVQGSATPR